MKWYDYRALYGTKKETVDLLNKGAPLFFSSLQQTMWEEVLLRLTRLTDKAEYGKKRTLTVRRIPPLISDVSLRNEAQAQVDEVITKCDFAREWRNRQIAHTELPPQAGEVAQPLPVATRQQVEDALASLRDVLNFVQRSYEKSTIAYETLEWGAPGGVQSALNVIRAGVKAREERFGKVRPPGADTEADDPD